MQFMIANGPMQTTLPFVKVTTGTSAKTMLQIKPLIPCRIVEWGASFDGSAAATPGEVELIETGTIFATVTASVAADVTAYDGEALLVASPSTFLTLGTTATGYTSSGEGSIVASRNLAGPQLIAGTNQFIQQFPLGYRPLVQIGYSGRIRMTFGAAVNAYCYMILEF